MITILVADDHAIVREGLKQILARTGDMVVAGEARNAQEVIRLVREREWNVVLMDMSMPGRSGIDLIKQVKDEKPKLPILVLSMIPCGERALRPERDPAMARRQGRGRLPGRFRRPDRVRRRGRCHHKLVGRHQGRPLRRPHAGDPRGRPARLDRSRGRRLATCRAMGWQLVGGLRGPPRTWLEPPDGTCSGL